MKRREVILGNSCRRGAAYVLDGLYSIGTAETVGWGAA
jgi:hypothetical protein